jgi:hypothetical protein
MPYMIQAEREGERIVATRNNPASAVVLAMKWTEKGLRAVVILTESGRRHDVAAAQKRLIHGLKL